MDPAATIERPAPAVAGRSRIDVALVLYLGAVFAWTLDFQAPEAGAGLAYQIWLLAAFLACTLLFFVVNASGWAVIPGLMSLGAATALFLAVAGLSGVLRGQGVYAVLRNALPTIIFLTAAVATARALFQFGASRMRFWLTVACFAYLVSGFAIGLATSLQTVETIRFQVVGSSVVAALALLAMALIFGIRRIEIASLVTAIAVVFVSVTRTYLLAAAIQVAPLMRHPRVWFNRRTAGVLILGAALLVVADIYADFGFTRWLGRLFVRDDNQGLDPTWEARLSEWGFMIDAATRSTDRFLFGNGLAAETTYIVPMRGYTLVEGSLGFGHNQYISLLFTAGLLGGGGLLWVCGSHIVRAWRLLLRFRSARAQGGDWIWITYFGAVIVIGFAVTTGFSSVFGHRGSSLWYGIGTGLLLGGQAGFLPVNRVQWAERQRNPDG